ncbi:flagellar assembly protein FliW [Uliginosibacterium sp. 31-16]|uniref:flagellar assembly protein FliW n=1 Tax=Uliginosibacterium sp. 31-16 TaxID=3068315 RepID=UPI00273F8504|nr:flagellar assembly protein FliW [Uliginosibacterium sp. 31-16]MDP5241064.1 flagellar assembly protein FliW [Uliginosibacterium sp. 31-16]
MKIDSPRFGSLEVAANKVIEFPAGLPGFENCKRFTLIEVASHVQEVAVLQSVEMPELAFSVTTPDLLGLHYEFALTEDEEKLLGAGSAEDMAVMLILRHEDREELHRRAGDGPVRANLMAPLVINGATMRGLQKVIAKLGCDVTLRSAD